MSDDRVHFEEKVRQISANKPPPMFLTPRERMGHVLIWAIWVAIAVLVFGGAGYMFSGVL